MSAWSDLDIPWNNVLDVQDVSHGNHNLFQGMNVQKICSNLNFYCPNPQKLSLDEDSFLSSGNEFEDHHLEQALVILANNGELEDFLKANTISLKEIQDDFAVSYGKASESLDFATKPRIRRNSIGTAEELIKCPFPGCNKIFNRSYNFKSHLKAHSCEKPFKCNNCSLSFARCHDLKRHGKIHDKTHQDAHKCDFCGKKFSRSDALNRHIRLNTCLNQESII